MAKSVRPTLISTMRKPLSPT